MPSSKDKTRINSNTRAIAVMAKERVAMIEAFQQAFRTLQGKIDEQGNIINMLCQEHPKILEQLQVQSKEAGTDEDSSRDAEPRILSLPGHRIDPGVTDISIKQPDSGQED